MIVPFRTLKQAGSAFVRDEGIVRASSLAFYTSLSLAPMVLLFVSITGLMGPTWRDQMIGTVEQAAGAEASEAVRLIAADASRNADEASRSPGMSLAISLAVVLFSAGGAFAAMQHGLNRVWNVKPAPGAGLKTFARKRLLSMGMVLTLGFLLLVSTVASTFIEMVLPGDGFPWNIVTFAASLVTFAVLFAAIFKVLPDVVISWRDVWFGGAATAAAFIVGKFAISMYLARAGFGDSYGAAGALVAWLVWAYYSAIIVYLGAEITQLHAVRAGRRIEPDHHAVRVEQVVTDGSDAAKASGHGTN